MDAPHRPILVALGSEARALRLIQAGFRLAQERSVPWIAAHVETGGHPAEDREQVQVWLQEAQRLGAEIRVIQAPTLAQGLTDLTRRTRAQVLLLGRSRDKWPWARMGHSTANELLRRGLDTVIEVVDEGSNPPQPHEFHDTGFGAMVGTLSVLAVCSGLAWLVPREGNIALVLPVYLAAVTFIAHRWGQGLAVLASVLGTLFYSFLLETPRFHQGAAPWPNLLFFLAMLLAAQAVMGLLRRLRQQAREVRRREMHTASLYLLGRALARCPNADQVGTVAAEHIRRVFKAEACLLFPVEDGWRPAPAPSLDPGLPPPAELLPRLEVGERPGDPLEPLAMGRAYCLSLSGTGRSEGVLQILPREAGGLPSETWELLKAFAVQIALALERLRWLEEARKAQIESETERLRSTLLGAIGHDLRTPLAAIHGAAGTLLLPGEVSESTRRDLLSMIQDESERLAHLLENLLDLTRLESGAIQVQKEWQPLEEVVGSALGRLEKRQGAMSAHAPFRVDLPEALPLVPIDAALIEQLLVNLLTNAQRHAQHHSQHQAQHHSQHQAQHHAQHHAPGQAVDLRAWEEPGWVLIEVADRGPGLPEGFEERIFDKFFRLPGAGEGGVGLGLAICRAIVQAHGGTIRAENRPGGGSSFRVALPLDGVPPLPPEPAEGTP